MRLVVSADDFGVSDEVNAAVEMACREGALTSASLMVTGGRVREAAKIARDTPSLYPAGIEMGGTSQVSYCAAITTLVARMRRNISLPGL